MTTATLEAPVQTADIIDPDAPAPVSAPAVSPSAEDEAAERAGFAEGYSEVTDTPLTETPGEDTKLDDEPLEPKPVAEAPAVPVSKVVEITEEKLAALEKAAVDVQDMRASLEKMSGTVFGKFGGLERTIKQLQDTTPRGKAIAITADDLKEMQAEYPELTEMTVAGFNRIFEKFQGTGAAVDMDALQNVINDRVQEKVASQREADLLETLSDHREDWFTVVGLDEENWKAKHPDKPYQPTEYRKWLAAQPKDYQDTINNSMRPLQVVKSIERFEKFVEDQKKAKAAAPKPSVAQTAQRRNRLAAAVVPDSTGSTSMSIEPTEAEEFANGFKEMQS